MFYGVRTYLVFHAISVSRSPKSLTSRLLFLLDFYVNVLVYLDDRLTLFVYVGIVGTYFYP